MSQSCLPNERMGHELLLRELGRLNTELTSQRRLSATTVHDLANPAQVVLGLSELLLEHQALDPVVRRRLVQMNQAAVTMTAMLSDLSAGLALGDADTLTNERIDLVALTAAVVDRTRVLANGKDMRLELVVDGHDDGSPDVADDWGQDTPEEGAGQDAWWVEGDSVKLERAVVNLLSNAIKFSRTARPSPSPSTAEPTPPRSP